MAEKLLVPIHGKRARIDLYTMDEYRADGGRRKTSKGKPFVGAAWVSEYHLRGLKGVSDEDVLRAAGLGDDEFEEDPATAKNGAKGFFLLRRMPG